MFERFLADRQGATSIEYATVVGLVSIIILVSATGIGGKLRSLFYGPLMAGFQ